MNSQFQRVGALRATLIVGVSAAAAIIALSASGLSPAGQRRPSATVKQPLPTSGAAPTLAPAPRRRARSRPRSTTQPRKRCRPVEGITFTVSADARCPRRLKGTRSRLSTRLRDAARRPRPTPTITPPAPVRQPPTAKTSPPTAETPAPSVVPPTGGSDPPADAVTPIPTPTP